MSDTTLDNIAKYSNDSMDVDTTSTSSHPTAASTTAEQCSTCDTTLPAQEVERNKDATAVDKVEFRELLHERAPQYRPATIAQGVDAHTHHQFGSLLNRPQIQQHQFAPQFMPTHNSTTNGGGYAIPFALATPSVFPFVQNFGSFPPPPPPPMHQQQNDSSATVFDPPPCQHNNWDNLRAKNAVVTLCCRDCLTKWKLQFPIKDLCSEFHSKLECAFGVNCPLLHVHRFKSVQKSPNPAGHVVGSTRDPLFAAVALEVMMNNPGKLPGEVVGTVMAQYAQKVAQKEAEPAVPLPASTQPPPQRSLGSVQTDMLQFVTPTAMQQAWQQQQPAQVPQYIFAAPSQPLWQQSSYPTLLGSAPVLMPQAQQQATMTITPSPMYQVVTAPSSHPLIITSQPQQQLVLLQQQSQPSLFPTVNFLPTMPTQWL